MTRICSYFWDCEIGWEIEGFLVRIGVIGLPYLAFLVFPFYIYRGQQTRNRTCLALSVVSPRPLSLFLLLLWWFGVISIRFLAMVIHEIRRVMVKYERLAAMTQGSFFQAIKSRNTKKKFSFKILFNYLSNW